MTVDEKNKRALRENKTMSNETNKTEISKSSEPESETME